MVLTPTQFLHIEVQQAVYQYFQLGVELVPTEADFSDWLAGLPPPLKVLSRAAGFGAAGHNLSFKRFLLEIRGFSLHDYLVQQLSPAAFAHWLTLDEHGSGSDANRWSLTNYHQIVARQQAWRTNYGQPGKQEAGPEISCYPVS